MSTKGEAKVTYTITRCGESWEFTTHQAAVRYGQKLTTVYGDGDPQSGTAVFLFRSDSDEPVSRIRRGSNVFEAYPEK